MATEHDIDVFFSYDHADRERIRPLVEEVERHGWAVWWDTEISIGSVWRDVLTDRLDHARAVCVIWTENSVSSRFVRDEASRAHERGVLVPVRLDPVNQPLGFGEIQYADLCHPAFRADAMRQVITRLERLVHGAAPVNPRQTEIRSSAQPALYGADEARWFLERVRALSDMFAANPGSSAGLRSALAGIRDTYAVVGESIDTFLAPVTKQGDLTLDRYRPLADGRLVTHISRQRGHCKRIAQVYIQSGGLRDSLPASVDADVRHELDDLVLMLSNADGDLFNAMASIGVALQNQAAVLINLLLADQEREAEARLRKDEEALLPLRQKVNEGMADVERISTELGVII
jgi:hypothetical protein